MPFYHVLSFTKGGKRSEEGRSGWGRRRLYLTLLCPSHNDSCIHMDSDESHFILSLIPTGKVTRQCLHYTVIKTEPSLSGIEPRSFCLPAWRLTARPNRLTKTGRVRGVGLILCRWHAYMCTNNTVFLCMYALLWLHEWEMCFVCFRPYVAPILREFCN